MTDPWTDEPNEAEWTSAWGSRCRVARSVVGTLAGYVALPVGHPWEDLPACDVPARVHGGCTWAGRMDPNGPWWVGFDCGHAATDVIPALMKLPPGLLAHISSSLFKGCVYRDLAYVKRETNELAAQAELAANGHHFGRMIEGTQ